MQPQKPAKKLQTPALISQTQSPSKTIYLEE